MEVLVKNQDFLPRQGNFYKANLHSHCTLSDGKWTKEQVKAEYVKKGYSIVAFTDHNYYEWHKDLQDENFVAIASFEVDINEEPPKKSAFANLKTYHLNMYDTKPLERGGYKTIPAPQCYDDIQALNDYIKSMSDLGFLVCYNHPWWSLQNYDDYKDLKGLFAMEIYNHGCEVDGLFGYAPQAYDEMLRMDQRLFCVSTDDNHDGHPVGHSLNDSFGGWVNIKADSLSYESVISALIAGNFYSSTGPELYDLYIEDDTVHIKCSPVQNIYMVNATRNCQYEVASPNKTITEAHFKLTGNEGYIRIDCEDKYRKHAYSNAYFLPTP